MMVYFKKNMSITCPLPFDSDVTNDTPLTDLPCQGQNQTTCLVLVNDTSNVGKEFF